MEFGIFSNGFRPHTTASQTYEEDLSEIVLADRLGFRDAYISEHHGEPVYIDTIDTLPVPELLMCKAAGLTTRIRMGAAVKLIHLAHPVDTAIQAAVTDHVVGGGRFIFGFGSGFPNPLFANERGLSHEDRHARLRESLDLILKCWTSREPFDWDGKHWRGKSIVATPRPLHEPHMPMATATDTEAMIELAGQRGYTLLAAQLEPAAFIRRKADRYARAAKAAGRSAPLDGITVARYVYLADSRGEAMDDLRPVHHLRARLPDEARPHPHHQEQLHLPFTGDKVTFDQLAEAGVYFLGDPDTVARQLEQFYDAAGGFGTLLIVTGKDWATRAKRQRSMQLFMEQVAPKLRGLHAGARARHRRRVTRLRRADGAAARARGPSMIRTGLLIASPSPSTVGLVFGIRPDLDLALVGAVLRSRAQDSGAATIPLYLRLRDASTWLITLFVAPAVVALALKLVRPRRPLIIPGRAVVLMLLTLALGPGVVANVVLKEHWGRPRPIDVTEFGGAEHFRPWWDPRGDCPKNCSFVAGEPSGAFWTLAPAALVPPPWRALADGRRARLRRRRRRLAHGGRRAFLQRRGVCRGVRLPGDLARPRLAVPLAAHAHLGRGGGAGARAIAQKVAVGYP